QLSPVLLTSTHVGHRGVGSRLTSSRRLRQRRDTQGETDCAGHQNGFHVHRLSSFFTKGQTPPHGLSKDSLRRHVNTAPNVNTFGGCCSERRGPGQLLCRGVVAGPSVDLQWRQTLGNS